MLLACGGRRERGAGEPGWTELLLAPGSPGPPWASWWKRNLKKWAAREGVCGRRAGVSPTRGMSTGMVPASLSCFSPPASPKGHGRPDQVKDPTMLSM